MHTECPHCQTLFNVTAEHLRVAHGVVRCGHCMDTFDALDALSDGDIEREADEEESTAVVEEHGDRQLLRTAAEHNRWMLADGDESTSSFEEQQSVPDFIQAGPMFDARDLAEVAGDAAAEEAVLKTAAAHIGDETNEVLSSLEGIVPGFGRSGDEPVEVDEANDEQAEESELDVKGLDDELTSLAAQEVALVEDNVATALEDDITVDTEIATPDSVDVDSAVPSVLEEDLARLHSARSNNRTGLIFAVLSVLLLIGCALQYVFFMPGDVVKRYPMSQPFVNKFCALAGCQTIEQRAPQLVQVVSRDVRVHPRYEGALQITAALVNSANFSQPYPNVQFTLFNVNGQTIAARIFEPREYLTDDTSVSAGMSPEIETQIQLDVLAPDEAAVSFEFKFF